MFKKTLNAIGFSICAIWAFWVILSWCTDAQWSELDHNVAASPSVTSSSAKEATKKSLPTFEEVITSYKESTFDKLESKLEESVSNIKEGDSKAEWKGKISVAYWKTKGTFSFDFSWAVDSALENILWYFSLWFWLENGSVIDEDIPDSLDFWWSFGVLLEQAKIFAQLWELRLDSLKSLNISDDFDDNKFDKINGFINKIKGKWIEFNQEKICDENSESYSEDWCEMFDWLKEFWSTLSWMSEKKIDKDAETQEMLRAFIETSKASASSLFSTKVLANPELTTYQGKQAYKFWLNQSVLKKDLKWVFKVLWEYYADKMIDKMKDQYASWWEEYEMTDEELKEEKEEMLEEFEEWLDEFFETVNVTDFVGYLVYDDKDDKFDVVIEKLEIQFTNEKTDYVYWSSFDDDDFGSSYHKVTTEETTTFTIAYSSIKDLLVIIISDDDDVKGKFNITWNVDDENANVNIKFSWYPSKGEDWYDDLVTVTIDSSNKNTEKTVKNSFNVLVNLSKNLIDQDEDISFSLETSSKVSFGEKFVRPDVSWAIPFAKVEKYVEELEKEMESPKDRDIARKSDLSQIWSAVISYYNNKWEYPRANSNKMISVKSIEKELIDVTGISSIPSDPLESNTFTFDSTRFVGEYGYKVMKKNSISNWWFMLMSKVETPSRANYVVWIPIPDDLKDFKLCWNVEKWNKASISEDRTCTYSSEDDLRYVYTF